MKRSLNHEQLKSLLMEAGLITPEKFDEALKIAKQDDVSIEVLLAQNGYVSDSHLGQIIANYFELHFVELSKEAIDLATQKLIPETVAKNKLVVSFKQDEKTVYLAMACPYDYEFISLLKKKCGKAVQVFYATPMSVLDALKNYRVDLGTHAAELIDALRENQNGTTEKNEDAVIELVDLFLESSYDRGASDIHIEPLKKKVSLRLRIDGILYESFSFPIEFHENIVSRIKILSKLAIDEHSSAQDGRFSFVSGSSSFDVRVSILPTINGENVVMRLLAESSRRLFIDTLGLDANDLEKLKRASLRPYGMVLSVGPTGAGKTTTLYSVLSILNRPEVNIMTIEDPVEYEIEEVRQTQVNTKKNITFANGLRSIVRQDPNIIMVGEIRDEETANIAVNAAMTGHLVLSTLHANDAATTFPRLFDMKVEPFLLASSINVIISQRLVRAICENCRVSIFLNESKGILNEGHEINDLLEQVFGRADVSNIRIYRGSGCKACGNTGYAGRTGIFEVLEMNDDLRSLIIQKASSEVIYKKAIETGLTSMTFDGLRKVRQGITTLEEVIRATKS